jgi:hypothetical protein
VQRPAGEGNAWAGPLATASLVASSSGSSLAAAFIGFVIVARRSKRRRRNPEQAPRDLELR